MKTIHAALLAFAGCGLSILPAHAATTPIFCQGGGSMSFQKVGSSWIINYERASQPANVAPPGPGECTGGEIAFAEGSATTLTLPSTMPNALLLLAAAKGGTFQVDATGENGSMAIKSIGAVNVVDAEPLSPGPDDEAAETDDEEDPVVADDGECGAEGDTATVSIADPDLKKLNVRKKPNGKIVGTVKEGKEVTLAGLCGGGGTAGAAGFAAAKKSSSAGWCAISAPLEGCVKAEFLDFDGGGEGTAGAVGLVKKN